MNAKAKAAKEAKEAKKAKASDALPMPMRCRKPRRPVPCASRLHRGHGRLTVQRDGLASEAAGSTFTHAMHFAYLVKFTPIDFLGSMRAWVTCDAAHMDCRSCEPSSFHRPLGLFIGVFGASVMGYPTGKGGKAGFGDLAYLLCHTQVCATCFA